MVISVISLIPMIPWNEMTWIGWWMKVTVHVPCSIPWCYATVLKGGRPSLEIGCQDWIHHNECRIISSKGLLLVVNPMISWDMIPTVSCKVTHVHSFFLLKIACQDICDNKSKDIFPKNHLHHLPQHRNALSRPAFGMPQHSGQSFDLTARHMMEVRIWIGFCLKSMDVLKSIAVSCFP